MKFKLLLSIVISTLVISFSCRTIVENDFPEFENTPVINAILISGDTIGVNVSLARKVDSISNEIITNALVKLFIDNIFVEDLIYNSDSGFYISNIVAEPKKEYKCLAFIEGYNTIECCLLQPAAPKIIDAKFISCAGIDEWGWCYQGVEITFENNTNEELFFEIRLLGADLRELYYEINDEIILKEGLPLPLFSNKHITDSVWTVRCNFIGNPEGIELRSVSEDYYKYKRSIYVYEQNLYPSLSIGSYSYYPIYSNIENAYGIFAAYSSSTSGFSNINP